MGFDVALDLTGVGRGMLDDLCVALILAAPKLQVIPGEIGMSEDVGGHQDVVGEAVAGREVGVSRVAGKHHLEQARIAHMPLQQLVDVARSEGPVRHAHRQSVDGDLGHEAVRYRLEDDRATTRARAVAPDPRSAERGLASRMSRGTADFFLPRIRLRLGAEEMAHRRRDIIRAGDGEAAARAVRRRSRIETAS